MHERGVQIAIVVGAGNIYRGMTAAAGMGPRHRRLRRDARDRPECAYAQDVLERQGMHTRVLSAIHVSEVAEPYIRRRAIRHLEKDRVVIFSRPARGTRSSRRTPRPRCARFEIGADAILMAKHAVEGVYDGDPQSSQAPSRSRSSRTSR